MNRSKVIIGVFIAIILIVIAIVLLACTVFVVREVDVESDVSSKFIDEEKIVEASGLSKGRSIISISKEKVTASIEKENPYVEVRSIRRIFPSKIVINVTVRTGVMLVTSSSGDSIAVVDPSMKVLNVLSVSDELSSSATVVKGLTFDSPDGEALRLIGTELVFSDEACGAVLKEIAAFASDYDLDGQSFSAFFKEIRFDTTDHITAYIKTNKGVSLVLDKSLASSVYDQMYICMYYYTTTKDVSVDRTKGYIFFDKEKNAYSWSETIA